MFQILSNPIFDGTNIELYSFWIKKRILVYEYGQGLWGKIKLGLEPDKEEGALVYFPRHSHNPLVDVLDGLFIYRHIQSPQYTITGVISKEHIQDNEWNILFQALSQCEALPLNMYRWKLIIATLDTASGPLDWIKTLVPDVLVVDYNNPPGRSAEDFIKDAKNSQ